MAIEKIENLRSLVVPLNRVKAILAFYYQRAGKKPSATGQHIYDVLRIIARHFVRRPESEVAQISAWAKPLLPHYTGMTEKNERTVRAVLEPATEIKLLLLPAALMKAARQSFDKSPVLAAQTAMRAVAIELLTKLPMRLGNLINLRLDEHLFRTNLSSGAPTYIDIPGEQVKNQRALSLPLSPATREIIAEWVSRFRPMIATPGSPFLFPGYVTAKKPITPQGMRVVIKSVTSDHLGVVVTPHQFRHIVARMFLSTYPGHYEEVRQILAHTDIKMTITSYAGIERESAIRRHDEVLAGRLANHKAQTRKQARKH